MNEEQRKAENLSGLHAYKDELLGEQVKQIYLLAPVGIVATLVNATITFFVLQQGGISERLLIPWLAAIYAVTFLRIGLRLRFQNHFRPEAATVWGRLFIVGLALIGIAWGSLGTFPFSELSPTQRVFIAFVLGGMTAGAATTFSSLRWGYLAFGIPALMPIGINFFLSGGTINYTMGWMILIFFLLLWQLSTHNYCLNCTSLRLRFENREMIDSLRQAKENAEGMSKKLLIEMDAKLKAAAELKDQQDHLERIVAQRTTELLKANEQLTAAKIAAETASRAKSEFLANMSHEIRTPMTVFLAAVEQLQKLNPNAEQWQWLKMADKSALRLRAQIDDILDFSRIEARQVKIKLEPFSLHACLRECVDMLNFSAREKALTLRLEIFPGVPEVVTGDRDRIAQVMINLVDNAIKFTEKGEVSVSARTEGSHLLVSVSDTGPGIQKGNRDLLFKSFSQVGGRSSEKKRGTGLGLAICKGLVDLMDGRIWMESRPGGGSTFSFRLPLKTDLQAPGKEKKVQKPKLEKKKGVRILLAEDEVMIRNMIYMILNQRGHQIEMAGNGREAFDLCQKEKYDLILMDMQMPEMDGMEATRKIRDLEKEKGLKPTRIVVLSADVRRETQEECFRIGVDDFITKPINFDALFSTVEISED